MHEEIKNILNSAQNLLLSCWLSKYLKAEMYKTIILTDILYGC
jgi:hypothetical protein